MKSNAGIRDVSLRRAIKSGLIVGAAALVGRYAYVYLARQLDLTGSNLWIAIALIVIGAIVCGSLSNSFLGYVKAIYRSRTTEPVVRLVTYVTFGLVIVIGSLITSSATILLTWVAMWLVILTGLYNGSYQRNGNINRKVSQILITDEPVGTLESLVKTQSRQATILRKMILGHPSNESLSISIDGEWGDAKSSIVQSVKNDIGSSESGEHLIWVEFQPWRYPNEQELIVNFYSTIGKAISSEIPTLANEGHKLVQFARTLVNSTEHTGILTSLMDQLLAGKDVIGDLDTKLKEFDKRLVVIFDDMDRLVDQQQVLRVLQLSHVVRTGDFVGSIVIMPADFKVIAEATNLGKDSTYLQKISEYTLNTVPPSYEEISNYFNDNLTMEIELLPHHFRLVRNFRGAVRVANQFNVLMPELQDTVHPFDVFSMCVLNHAASFVTADIKNHRRMYVEYDDGEGEEWRWLLLDDDSRKQIRRTHFEKLLKDVTSDQKRNDIQSVVEDLFYVMKNALSNGGNAIPDLSEMARERRIGLQSYLLAYLFHREEALVTVSQANRAAQFIKRYRSFSSGERTEYAISYFKNLEKPTIAKVMMRAIEEAVSTYPNDKPFLVELGHDMLAVLLSTYTYLRRGEYYTVQQVLSSFDSYLVDETIKKRLLGGLVAYFTEPSVAITLLYYLNPDKSNENSNAKHYDGYTTLKSNMLQRIDGYYTKANHDLLDEYPNDDDWLFILIQWGLSIWFDKTETVDPVRRQLVEKYIIGLVMNDEQKLMRVINAAYYRENLYSNDNEMYFDIKAAEHYPIDLIALRRIARKAHREQFNSLTTDQRRQLGDFLDAAKAYLDPSRGVTFI